MVTVTVSLASGPIGPTETTAEMGDFEFTRVPCFGELVRVQSFDHPFVVVYVAHNVTGHGTPAGIVLRDPAEVSQWKKAG